MFKFFRNWHLPKYKSVLVQQAKESFRFGDLENVFWCLLQCIWPKPLW